MRRMREFIKDEKLGTLYIDRILFETYYPIEKRYMLPEELAFT